MVAGIGKGFSRCNKRGNHLPVLAWMEGWALYCTISPSLSSAKVGERKTKCLVSLFPPPRPTLPFHSLWRKAASWYPMHPYHWLQDASQDYAATTAARKEHVVSWSHVNVSHIMYSHHVYHVPTMSVTCWSHVPPMSVTCWSHVPPMLLVTCW
jgi:hypothetical protein